MVEEEVIFKQREQLIYELIEFNNNESNRICSLDGAWGSGKSFFIDKFIDQVKDATDDEINNDEQEQVTDEVQNGNKSFDILKFDAWENQGNGNINAIFLEFLFDELESRVYDDKPYLEYMKDHGKEWIGEFFGFLSETILPKSISKIVDIVKKGYKDFQDTKTFQAYGNQLLNQILDEKSFYDILIEMLVKEEKYLIIIDELDRCEPKYAMDIIKKVVYINKKLKAKGNNVNFLISINKIQFSNMLAVYYGSNYDVYQYFDKIFDYEFDLPEAKNSYDYVGAIISNRINGIDLKRSLETWLSFKSIESFEALNSNYRKLNILAEKMDSRRPDGWDDLQYKRGFDPYYYFDRMRFIFEVIKLENYKEYLKIKEAIIRLRKNKNASIDSKKGQMVLHQKINSKEKYFNDIRIISGYFKKEGLNEVGIIQQGNISKEEEDQLFNMISPEMLCLMKDYPI